MFRIGRFPAYTGQNSCISIWRDRGKVLYASDFRFFQIPAYVSYTVFDFKMQKCNLVIFNALNIPETIALYSTTIHTYATLIMYAVKFRKALFSVNSFFSLSPISRANFS